MAQMFENKQCAIEVAETEALAELLNWKPDGRWMHFSRRRQFGKRPLSPERGSFEGEEVVSHRIEEPVGVSAFWIRANRARMWTNESR